MSKYNLIFFKEYTKLDNLLKRIYVAPQDKAGVTHYLEQMKAAEERGYRYDAAWERMYKKLRYWRHMRNNMAHNADAFETENVSEQDVVLIRGFYREVLECEDPLAPLFGRKKPKKKRPSDKENTGCWVAIAASIVLAAIILICVLHP